MNPQLLFVALLVTVVGDTFFPDLDQEVAVLQKKDFVGYAALHGMNLTYHEVVTSDGWILELWRVRCMNISDSRLSAPVIFYHGFGGSAFDFMWNLRNESAAFIFADNGFDVWLPNFRSNHFSNRILENGRRRKPTATKYYRAAWQYQADRDFPATLSKVLSETKQSKIYLVGHSMGGTVVFAFLSGNHSYDDKISHFFAMTPVLKFGWDTPFPFILGVIFGPPLLHLVPRSVFESIYGRQLYAYASESPQAFAESVACKIVPAVCGAITELLLGRDLTTLLSTDLHMNKTRAQVYETELVAGLSLMQAFNFIVEGMEDLWTKIDFDSFHLQTGLTNVGEYNTDEPPELNFPEAKVPFSMYFVANDPYNGPVSVRERVDELKATDVKFINGSFSHVDVVLGRDTRCFILDDILAKMSELETQRDPARKDFRKKVEAHLNELPYENGCSHVPH